MLRMFQRALCAVGCNSHIYVCLVVCCLMSSKGYYRDAKKPDFKERMNAFLAYARLKQLKQKNTSISARQRQIVVNPLPATPLGQFVSPLSLGGPVTSSVMSRPETVTTEPNGWRGFPRHSYNNSVFHSRANSPESRYERHELESSSTSRPQKLENTLLVHLVKKPAPSQQVGKLPSRYVGGYMRQKPTMPVIGERPKGLTLEEREGLKKDKRLQIAKDTVNPEIKSMLREKIHGGFFTDEELDKLLEEGIDPLFYQGYEVGMDEFDEEFGESESVDTEVVDTLGKRPLRSEEAPEEIELTKDFEKNMDKDWFHKEIGLIESEGPATSSQGPVSKMVEDFKDDRITHHFELARQVSPPPTPQRHLNSIFGVLTSMFPSNTGYKGEHEFAEWTRAFQKNRQLLKGNLNGLHKDHEAANSEAIEQIIDWLSGWDINTREKHSIDAYFRRAKPPKMLIIVGQSKTGKYSAMRKLITEKMKRPILDNPVPLPSSSQLSLQSYQSKISLTLPFVLIRGPPFPQYNAIIKCPYPIVIVTSTPPPTGLRKESLILQWKGNPLFSVPERAIGLNGYEAAAEILYSDDFQNLPYERRVLLPMVDADFVPWIVAENYLACGDKPKELEDVVKMARAANAVARADRLFAKMHSQQMFSLSTPFLFLASLLPPQLVPATKNQNHTHYPPFVPVPGSPIPPSSALRLSLLKYNLDTCVPPQPSTSSPSKKPPSLKQTANMILREKLPGFFHLGCGYMKKQGKHQQKKEQLAPGQAAWPYPSNLSPSFVNSNQAEELVEVWRDIWGDRAANLVITSPGHPWGVPSNSHPTRTTGLSAQWGLTAGGMPIGRLLNNSLVPEEDVVPSEVFEEGNNEEETEGERQARVMKAFKNQVEGVERGPDKYWGSKYQALT